MGGLNFCRTFISSISLVLELAGSNLVQTLLNLLMPSGISHFCLVSLLFLQMREKNLVVWGRMLSRKKDFIKIDDF